MPNQRMEQQQRQKHFSGWSTPQATLLVAVQVLLLHSIVFNPYSSTVVVMAKDSSGIGSSVFTKTFMREMLDDMSVHYGDLEFPNEQYNQLIRCFNKWNDPLVFEVQNTAWKTLYETFQIGSLKWGTFATEDKFLESFRSGPEYFGSPIGTKYYEVQEPCNYVSNVAMYSTTIRICEYDNKWFAPPEIQQAFMKITATLAVSSFWFHGSMTNVGAIWDGKAIAVCLKSVYQMAISSIETDSIIFLTASPELHIPTGIVEGIDQITLFPLNTSLPLENWADFIEAIPAAITYQEYGVVLSAFSCAVSTYFNRCEILVNNILAPAFLTSSQLTFIKDQYMPELRIIAQQEQFPIPLWLGLPNCIKVIGTLLDFVWSIAFQEKAITLPCQEGQYFNLTAIGRYGDPFIESIVRVMTKIQNTQQNTYDGKQEYPGAKYCNKHSPHALWHELSADSLYKVIILGDEMNELLTKQKERRSNNNNNIRNRLRGSFGFGG